jgi:hypothetical protein
VARSKSSVEAVERKATDGNGYSHSDNYCNGHAETYTIAKAAPESGTAP